MNIMVDFVILAASSGGSHPRTLMSNDKNREECHKKYDRPRLMVQLDTLTKSHEHPGSFGGVATLGAEACLAVLSCVVPDVAKVMTTQK